MEYLCPTHFEPLCGVLAGGAGHCAKCGLYVQAHGVPMPTLPPEQMERCAAALESERKARKRAYASKRRKVVLASKPTDANGTAHETKNATTGDSAQRIA